MFIEGTESVLVGLATTHHV